MLQKDNFTFFPSEDDETAPSKLKELLNTSNQSLVLSINFVMENKNLLIFVTVESKICSLSFTQVYSTVQILKREASNNYFKVNLVKPIVMTKFPNLNELTLSFCKLTTIESLSQVYMPNLSCLNLQGNFIVTCRDLRKIKANFIQSIKLNSNKIYDLNLLTQQKAQSLKYQNFRPNRDTTCFLPINLEELYGWFEQWVKQKIQGENDGKDQNWLVKLQSKYIDMLGINRSLKIMKKKYLKGIWRKYESVHNLHEEELINNQLYF